MVIEETYNEILEKLREDKRPLLRLSPEDIQDLHTYWAGILDAEAPSKHQNIMKVLCILDHSQGLSRPLLPLFIETLKTVKNTEIQIFTLSASIKHIVETWFRTGDPLPSEYIVMITSLIETTKEPEVLEWLLRVVESCGGQSFKFKDVILKNRPGLLSLLNKHNRNSIEIIDLLVKRWPNV
ncbi:MAG: hypothetical protein KC493_01255 [Bacteriovoracaceae bacterium]|nr:hypothetical protein [Bacteriovoracaceae bacterium]